MPSANDSRDDDTSPYSHGAVARARGLIEATPERIGRYRVLERIGQGGMGEVYRVEQRDEIRRELALKLIKLGMDTKQVVARFEAERQALALMDHPHIARVVDAGADDSGRPYFVMELVRGVPITQYADEQRLSIDERLRLFLQVCGAVQHAHQKGIIHRDLKPSNILVSTQDGKPLAKVIDFGIAKATAGRLTDKTLYTEFANFIGTPQYMSPEQAAGSLDIDTRSDVYSLGVLLYELVSGHSPFDADTLRNAALAEIARILREVDPPRPSTRLTTAAPQEPKTPTRLSQLAAERSTEPASLVRQITGEIDWLVMKALEKDRSRRYASPADFAEDIERRLAGLPVEAAPPSVGYRFRKLAKKHRVPVTLAGTALAALVLVVTGTSYGLLMANQEKAQKESALTEAVAQKKKAEKARAEVVEQKTLTEQKNDELERLAYRNGLALAQQAIGEHATTAALELLDECPERLRGWEWRSLRAAADDSLGVVEVPRGFEILSHSPEGSYVLLGSTSGDPASLELMSSVDGSRIKVDLPSYKRVLSTALSANAEKVAVLVRLNCDPSVSKSIDLEDPETVLYVFDRLNRSVVWSKSSKLSRTDDLFLRDLSIAANGHRVALAGIPRPDEAAASLAKAGVSAPRSISLTSAVLVLDVTAESTRTILDAPAGGLLSPTGEYYVCTDPSLHIVNVDTKQCDTARRGTEDVTVLGFHRRTPCVTLYTKADFSGRADAFVYNMKTRKYIQGDRSDSFHTLAPDESLPLYAYSKYHATIVERYPGDYGALDLAGRDSWPSTACLDAVSKQIFLIGDSEVRRFPLPEVNHLKRAAECRFDSLASSRDGRHILGVSTEDERLCVWANAATGEAVDSVVFPHHVDVAACSPTEDFVVAGLGRHLSLWRPGVDGGIKQIDVAASKDGGWISRVCVSSDGKYGAVLTEATEEIEMGFAVAIEGRNYLMPDSDPVGPTDRTVTLFDTVSGALYSQYVVKSDAKGLVGLSGGHLYLIANQRLVVVDAMTGEAKRGVETPPCTSAAISWRGDRIALTSDGEVSIRQLPSLELLSTSISGMLSNAGSTLESPRVKWLPDESRVTVADDGCFVAFEPDRGEIVLESLTNREGVGGWYPEWVHTRYVQRLPGPWSETPTRDLLEARYKVDREHEPLINAAIKQAEELSKTAIDLDDALKTISADKTITPVERYVQARRVSRYFDDVEQEVSDIANIDERTGLLSRLWEVEDTRVLRQVKKRFSSQRRKSNESDRTDSAFSSETSWTDAAMLQLLGQNNEAYKVFCKPGVTMRLIPNTSAEEYSMCMCFRAMAAFNVGDIRDAKASLTRALRYLDFGRHIPLLSEAAELIDPTAVCGLDWTPSPAYVAHDNALDADAFDATIYKPGDFVTVKGYVSRAVLNSTISGANLLLNKVPSGIRVWVEFHRGHGMEPELIDQVEGREIVAKGNLKRYVTKNEGWSEWEIVLQSADDLQILGPNGPEPLPKPTRTADPAEPISPSPVATP